MQHLTSKENSFFYTRKACQVKKTVLSLHIDAIMYSFLNFVYIKEL
jgi:hypothetical protein